MILKVFNFLLLLSKSTHVGIVERKLYGLEIFESYGFPLLIFYRERHLLTGKLWFSGRSLSLSASKFVLK